MEPQETREEMGNRHAKEWKEVRTMEEVQILVDKQASEFGALQIRQADESGARESRQADERYAPADQASR